MAENKKSKQKKAKCPRCGSEDAEIYDYMGVECIRCPKCGYDSCAELDITPSERSSSREKGRFSPYKAGRK